MNNNDTIKKDIKKWNDEFQPNAITAIDLDEMFKEHLKNHPELKDEQ